MKFRKITAFALALATMFCTSVSTMAVGFTAEARQAAQVAAAKEIAYMDIEAASPELKADILEARNVIIFNETWIADGYEATATEPDGTVYKVPHFSELFPGWDLPVVAPPRNVAFLRAGTTGEGDARTMLKNPSTTVNSDPFLTAYGFEESLDIRVKKLDTSATCNIGFTNDETGESVGVFTRKTVGFSCGIDAVPGTAAYISVRGSTYSTPGYATFHYNYW